MSFRPGIVPKTELGWIARTPIAHRGLHDRARGIIENTRSAFLAAIDRGYAIECDVQLSRDGEAVIFHDDTIDRLTGQKGHVRAMDANALGGIPLTGAHDRIEPLSALLTMTLGGVPLVVEIKSDYGGDPTLLKRVLMLIEGYAGPLVLKSFDPKIIIALRQIAPHVSRGIVSMRDYGDDPETAHLSKEEMRILTDMLHFPESEPDFISWHVGDLPCAAPFFANKLLDRPLMTWTVRTAEQRERAARHADQMIFEGFLP
jgi:glycerophosphoryl diester phosphodiesterase